MEYDQFRDGLKQLGTGLEILGAINEIHRVACIGAILFAEGQLRAGRPSKAKTARSTIRA